MTSPLAPPPPTGNPIDRWLYLLWRKLTATGQLFWSSIAPGTSADVAAAVTDETGSPGSLVFSGNPTLAGVTVNGANVITDSKVLVGTPTGIGGASGQVGAIQIAGTTGPTSAFDIHRYSADATPASFRFYKSRGAAVGTETAVTSGDQLLLNTGYGYDGTQYTAAGSIVWEVDGAVSAGVVPGRFRLSLFNSAGTQLECFRADSTYTITMGGAVASPALKVIPDATPSTQRRVEITAGAAAGNPTIGVSGGKLAVSAAVVLSQGTLLETSVALTNGAAAAAGTLLNAPAAGNPTKWIPINDNGTTRYIPAW